MWQQFQANSSCKMSIAEAFLSQLNENNNWVSHGGGQKWKKDAEQFNFEMFCSRSFVMFVNTYMCTFTHVHQESMSIQWSQGLRDQKLTLVLVIYHSGCYLFLLFQFLSLSLSLARAFNLHMRCYLGLLNQVTSHSCLCPWEDGVVLTVRTHCSTGEE